MKARKQSKKTNKSTRRNYAGYLIAKVNEQEAIERFESMEKRVRELIMLLDKRS